MVLANLVQLYAASKTFVLVSTQPVGGKVTPSNLSTNGNAAPAGAEITVNVEVNELFAEIASAVPFGLITVAENV